MCERPLEACPCYFPVLLASWTGLIFSWRSFSFSDKPRDKLITYGEEHFITSSLFMKDCSLLLDPPSRHLRKLSVFSQHKNSGEPSSTEASDINRGAACSLSLVGLSTWNPRWACHQLACWRANCTSTNTVVQWYTMWYVGSHDTFNESSSHLLFYPFSFHKAVVAAFLLKNRFLYPARLLLLLLLLVSRWWKWDRNAIKYNVMSCCCAFYTYTT